MNLFRITHDRFRSQRSASGYVLLLSLVIVFIMTTIGISIASVASSKYTKTKRDIYADTALYTAEAGLSDTVSRFNDDPDFAGYTTATPYFNKSSSGRTTFTTSVVNNSATQKTVTSTGNIYIPNSFVGTNPIATRTVKAIVSLNTNTTNYSMYAGAGGIKVGANTLLQGFNIFSLGKVDLTSSGSAIGYNDYPVNIDVANITCTNPTTSVFPSSCLGPQLTEPITIGGGSSGITGTVCANNQANGSGIVPGPSGKGLIQSCAPVRNTLQKIDRAQIISAAPAIFDPSSANCNNNDHLTPASGTYNGTVTLTNCFVYEFPPIMYVNGDLNINNSWFKTAESGGIQGSIIMVTGSINVNGANSFGNNSGGKTKFVSFKSSNNSCSTDPTCNSTPNNSSGWTDRQNSLSVNAVNLTGGATMQGSDFVGYFGGATINGPVGANSLYAQKITLGDNARGVFIANKQNNDLIQARWSIVDYQRKYNS